MGETDGELLSTWRRQHIGRALARARWMFEEQFETRIREAGYHDFRRSDVDVIARIPVDSGSRMTELADRIGVSKQAVGKLVHGLESRRYVLREPDPTDGRAQRIVLSKRGKSFLSAATHVISEIENEWAKVLSPAGLSRLRNALLSVSDALGDADYL